jgi:hypothetical protein
MGFASRDAYGFDRPRIRATSLIGGVVAPNAYAGSDSQGGDFSNQLDW